MAIVEMRKVTLLGMVTQKEKCIEALMKFGCVEQIECVKKKSNSLLSERAKSAYENFGRILKHLQTYDTRKKTIFYQALSMNFEAETWKVVYDEAVRKCETCLELSLLYDQLLVEIKKCESTILGIKCYEGLEIPLHYNSNHCQFIVGNFKEVENKLKFESEKINLCEYREIPVKSQGGYFALIFHREVEAEIIEMLKKQEANVANFSHYPFGVGVKEIVRSEEEHLAELFKDKQVIEEKFKEYAKGIELFEKACDYVKIQMEQESAKDKLYSLEYTFILQGWIAKMDEKVLENLVNSLGVSMKSECVQEGDTPPTLLSNNRFSTNFETITKQYSLPKYKSIDPNFFLSFFFVVFFGMMIGDAGYGVIITLVAIFLLRQKGISGTTHKMVKILFYCGISTIVFGALFGSWWGNLLQLATKRPEWNLAIWFDPVRDPMKLLVICCVLGMLHLLVGLLLKGWGHIQKREYSSALFDVGFWILFLAGVLLLFFPTIQKVGMYVAIIGALGLIVTQGRREKNIIKRLLIGLLSLYGITGYLSDVLSYSRILALGLATGIIATVINTIATLFGFSIISVVLFIIVMIIGHTFNILINTLGAYIHASRLQYIEFFGKFYEGDGREFNPLREPRKYTKR